MTAVFLTSAPFVVNSESGSISPTTMPARHVAKDYKGLVWRGDSGSYIVIDLGATRDPYSCVAVMGHNLSNGASFTVTTSNTISGAISTPSATFTNVGAYVGGSVYSGKTLATNAQVSHRYVCVKFNLASSGLPYAEVNRVMVGTPLFLDGIDTDCENYFEDQSVVTKGTDFESFEQYDTRMSWRVKSSWIKDEKWRSQMKPFFAKVGLSKSVFFAPRWEGEAVAGDYFEEEAIWGRITSNAKGSHPNHENWNFDLTVTSIVL